MSQSEMQKQQQLIASLLNPACYPHPAKKIQLIETHISWVLLAGRFAYKIKKALNLGFLNTLSQAARKHDCNEELRLNHRLAPRLYLEVIAIGGSYEKPKLCTQPAIEYAVKMHRFNARNTFDQLMQCGKINTKHMNLLAHTLFDFHASLPSASNQNQDYSDTLLTSLQQNFLQLATLSSESDALDELYKKTLRLHEHLAQSLSLRHAQGFIRECHGDLHLGNIALIRNTPTPFDGIDFNTSLRWVDVIDEVSFLFMDVLHKQQPALAYHFLNAYLELSGDYAGVKLLDFYCAHRALVRAKVASIRSSQLTISPPNQKKLADSTQAYLKLAESFFAPRKPLLIITHGLPGSGKTYFSQAALEHLGAIRIRSDVERKRFFGLSALAQSQTLSTENIYSTETTLRTYAYLLKTTRELLTAGHSVIVDAAFLKRDERVLFKLLAEELQIPFAIVSLQSGHNTLCSRIAKRQSLDRDASEANVEVLKTLAAVQEPISLAEGSYTLIYHNEHEFTINQSTWSALTKILTNANV
jgi:aminoglycoside phosphotransferase family enzyme/predicted kinase